MIQSKLLQNSQSSDSDTPTPLPMRFSSISSSSSSLRSTYKNVLCVVIGFIIGIYATSIWLRDTAQCGSTPVSSLKIRTRNKTNATIAKESSSAPGQQEATAVDVDMVEYLHNTTRVLCWITTNPDNHLTKAIHIRNTWGRRCNKLLFMSSQEDEVLQTVALPVAEGREHLWSKTKLALKYIYDHHLDDAEWFLKADDDTYVIMENLRSFLYPYPADIPLYFGCKFDRFLPQGYMSGGAGYVLSKDALVKFATEAYNNRRLCTETYKSEDLQLGACLENIGIIAGDSRDAEGRERFVPLPPEYVIPDIQVLWYSDYVYHSANEKVTCCSPEAISFHYIKPNVFYIMEYFLYSLRPFGLFARSTANLPEKVSNTDIFSLGLQSYFHPLAVPPADDTTADSKDN